MPPTKEETTAALLLRRHWKPAEDIPVATGPGSHGGGDARMLEALLGGFDDDTRADHEDGSDALLTGLAANASIASGRPERISDLLERG